MIYDARGKADQGMASGVQVELSGPMTRALAKKLKETMQALVCATYNGVDHANIIHELEKERTIRYTLIQALEPSEAKLGDSSEV